MDKTRVVGHFLMICRLGMLMPRHCRWGSLADRLNGWHGENGMRASRRSRRLFLPALTAVALVVAPFNLPIDGSVVTKAYADKGGNGGGRGGGNGNGGNGNGNGGNSGSAAGSNSGNSGNNGNGNGNSGGGNSGNGNGNSGGGNNGNGNGNSGGGNNGNGNGNSGGDNGNSGGNSGNSNGNSGTDNGNSTSNGGTSSGSVDSHVNALTGDKVDATRTSIQVTHRNGMKETVENGRFRMEDKYGRTIVDRKATRADLNRLKSL